jgi:regulator of replication initiation timing
VEKLMKRILSKIFIATAIIFMFITHAVNAQNIVNTLATGGYYYILNGSNTYFTLQQSTGLVGIGTNATVPKAQLHVGGTDGLLVTGTVNSGTVRALGAGLRLHWYPRKGAFRAGMAETTYWDDDGSTYPKIALYSCAIGYMPRATATASYALGAYCKSTGDYSVTLGSYNYASGSHAIAIGTQVMASGIYSIALGAGADTNGKDGSMVVGDDTYFQTAYASADNQITMRFSGGYRFWSSYPDSVSGVYMRHGQSGWSNYCDRNMKENFEPVDCELVLEKIKNLPITKWNYKKTDPTEKYIGPVSQDFYAAFHLNGTDSLGINSISMDGVNMAGIKALAKRTSEMNEKMQKIIEQNERLVAENEKLREQLSNVSKVNDELKELGKLKEELKEQIKLVKAKNEHAEVAAISK